MLEEWAKVNYQEMIRENCVMKIGSSANHNGQFKLSRQEINIFSYYFEQCPSGDGLCWKQIELQWLTRETLLSVDKEFSDNT